VEKYIIYVNLHKQIKYRTKTKNYPKIENL